MKKIKYILLTLILLLLIPNVFASNKVTTYNRSSLKNYGVNKKWNITSKNINNVLKTPLVDSKEKIYDFSGVINDSDKATIKEKIDTFREKYKTEIVIVTYDLAYNEDSDNDVFASDFYDYNDFGIDYEKYDGIVLFRNTYSIDPYYDMYTFGEAQLYFTHSKYDEILDGIYDQLHSGDYLNGFSYFIDMVSSTYEEGIPSDLSHYIVDENGYLHKLFYPSYFLITVISFLITLFVIGHYVKKNKMVKEATTASTYLNKNSVNYSVRKDVFKNKHLSSYTVSSSSGSGGGGGYSSSSGSSGGGFSSGGGRHG